MTLANYYYYMYVFCPSPERLIYISLSIMCISGDDFYGSSSFTFRLKMSATLRVRRILQTTDIDAFNGIPETTLSLPRKPPPDPTAAPSDSSMALTIFLLLTALFFLGFFSVYIRRFATSPPSPPPPPGRKGGLDSSAIDSLPLVAYGGAAKHPMIEECRICLSDFTESETVKLIPYCGHVFHPTCIDTWLRGHVTCPLCRSAELFESVVDEVCLDVAPHRNDACAPVIGQRSTVGSHAGVRRACSCSDLANRAALHRSASF